MSGFDKLELSTETLRELTRGELTSVAGGADASGAWCVTWTPLTFALVGWATQQAAQLTDQAQSRACG